MSQSIFTNIVPSSTSGNQLATYLNDFKAAILSGFSGTTRPSEVTAGGYWMDTSSAGYLIYRLYDGSSDIEVFRINLTTHTASSTSADDLFTITKISADTAAPFMTFIKKRIANDGQVLIGDYIGTLEFKGDDNSGATPAAARIRVVATNNFTTTTFGTDIVFEATTVGAATVAEAMRIRDGKLGIGTNDPQDTLHALGTGIRGEKASDDAVGARMVLKKRRITGTGAVQSGDVVAEVQYKSADDVSSSIDVAKVIVTAAENHTSTAQGIVMDFQVKKAATAVLAGMMTLGTKITSKQIHAFEAMIEMQQGVDSATTGAAQSVSPTKGILKVTNASLTSINNIATPVDGKLLILINGTGASISLVNESGGTAANRIRTGTGVDLTVFNGASVFLAYDANATVWQVVGGSGGGGAVIQGTRQTGVSISAATAITPTIGQESLIFVVGNGGPVTVTATPPVIVSGMTIGQKARIIGTSDANTVTYESGNNLVLNGPATLAKDQTIDIQYVGTDGANAAWIETARSV